jgi:hypothetical protein|tara:strand:+ start:7474 stop:8913 length:1440 start_codon:yes stop_codon:yes gene_type:complete
MKFKSWPELQAHWNYIDSVANDDGVTSSKMQRDMIKGGDPRLAAVAAWKELMPYHQTDATTSERVFQALFDNDNPVRIRQKDISFNRENKLSYLEKNGFPSQYEDKDTQKAFSHLMDILETSEAFPNLGYEQIADIIFKPFVTYDSGSSMNMIFTNRELKNLNVTIDDIEENTNYPVIRALKENKTLKLKIENDSGFTGLKTLQTIKKRIQENDSGDSIWTAHHMTNDGKAMEVVLMTGDRNDKDNRHMIGKWTYEDKDKNGDIVSLPLQYKGREEILKVLTAYKRGNFMDIDNDDDIYDQVERWYNEGPSSWMDSIYDWRPIENLITSEYQPFNIGKFEYNQVVKPFWEKYGPMGENLNKVDLAAKWEEVRLNETYTYEEKVFDHVFGGTIDTFRSDVKPFRHGSGSYSKTDGSLGNREPRASNLFLLPRSDRSIRKQMAEEIQGDISDTGKKGSFLNKDSLNIIEDTKRVINNIIGD